LAIAQNGGLSGQEVDDGDMDGETEVDMDDDMMDKISSSPSIEDGGSTSIVLRSGPGRANSPFPLAQLYSLAASSMFGDARSPSLYPENPEQTPPVGAQGAAPAEYIPCYHHHHHHHHPSCQVYGEFQARDPAGEPLSIGFHASTDSSNDRGCRKELGTNGGQPSLSGSKRIGF
jgi:hypothetical protein